MVGVRVSGTVSTRIRYVSVFCLLYCKLFTYQLTLSILLVYLIYYESTSQSSLPSSAQSDQAAEGTASATATEAPRASTAPEDGEVTTCSTLLILQEEMGLTIKALRPNLLSLRVPLKTFLLI